MAKKKSAYLPDPSVSSTKRSKQAGLLKRIKETIISAIQDKKGEDIVCLDLRKTDATICDYFIICHGTSSPQIKSITDAIAEKVYKVTGQKPWHIEGYENLEWVLIDYVDIVVHVFSRTKREFYALEELWSDASIKVFQSM